MASTSKPEVTSVTIKHDVNSDEKRYSTADSALGKLTSCVMHISWNINTSSLTKIELKLPWWDNSHTKWVYDHVETLPANATSYNFDIVNHSKGLLLPESGGGGYPLKNFKVNVKPYYMEGNKEKAGKDKGTEFVFTTASDLQKYPELLPALSVSKVSSIPDIEYYTMDEIKQETDGNNSFTLTNPPSRVTSVSVKGTQEDFVNSCSLDISTRLLRINDSSKIPKKNKILQVLYYAKVPVITFGWNLNKSNIKSAEALEKYNHLIVSRGVWEYVAPPSTVDKEADAFKLIDQSNNYNKARGDANPYSGDTYNSWSAFFTPRTPIKIGELPGRTEWFRLLYLLINGSDNEANNTHPLKLLDSSVPMQPEILSVSDLSLSKLTLLFTIHASSVFTCNSVSLEAGYGTPINSSVSPNYTLDELIPPTNITYSKYGNPFIPRNGPTKDDSKRTEIVDLGSTPQLDQVCWVRLTAENGLFTNSSVAKCVGGNKLAKPTITRCEINVDEGTILIAVTNNSVFPGVRIAILETVNGKEKQINVLNGSEQTPWQLSFAYEKPADPNEKPQYTAIAFYGVDAANARIKSDPSNYVQQADGGGGGGGSTPADPIPAPMVEESVTVSATEGIPGSVTVKWAPNSSNSNGAEISWADHEDAWNSNEGPNTYVANSIERNPSFNIRGLTAGKWYIKVRPTNDGGSTFGGYTKATPFPYYYSSEPDPSALSIEPSHISVSSVNSFRASWAYQNTDNSTQKSATIYEVERNNDSYSIVQEIASVKGEDTSLNVFPWPDGVNKFGWNTGSQHELVVQVISEDGTTTGKKSSIDVIANPKISAMIYIDEPPIKPANFNVTNTDIFASGFQNGHLVEMPMFIKLRGFPNADDIVQPTDEVQLIITRKYELTAPDRPDESSNDGFAGEMIFSVNKSGMDLTNGGIWIYNSDLVGHLDDNCDYDILMIITNSVGLSTPVNTSFDVKWNKQACKPSSVVLEKIVSSNGNIEVAITPSPGESVAQGSMFDIYRLTSDKPILIVEGGTYGDTYVDPYPAKNGGYRIVDRTINGDWISELPSRSGEVTNNFIGDGETDTFILSNTPQSGSTPQVFVDDVSVSYTWDGSDVIVLDEPPADNSDITIIYTTDYDQVEVAWIDAYLEDYGIHIDFYGVLIDFDDIHINLPFNVKLSKKWNKDFEATKYLNGNIVGDWNYGVARTITICTDYLNAITQDLINSDSEKLLDEDTLDNIVDLADYPGICHIRTSDGVSQACDIQVSEDKEYNNELNSYNIEVTIVSSEKLDGYKM